MPLVIISINNRGVLEGSKGGDWPLIIIVNNSINKITSEGPHNFPCWFVIVQLYNLGRSFVYASVSKFLGV